jgi:hypothetical protein
MSFFNKKEEVMDIELTQLGKYLLSKGKFKPVYYVFSDDEILYSSKYVSDKTERAKESSTRIQKDTQRLKTMYEHDGVESRILALNGHEISKRRGLGWQARKTGRIEELPAGDLYGGDFLTVEKMGADDRNLVRNMIGNSTVGEQTVPSWEVESILHGEINSVNISSSSPNVGIKRPVITMNVDYTMKATPISTNEADYIYSVDDFNTTFSGIETSISFTDQMRLEVEDNALVLSMIERGTEYRKENFEVEFFEVENKEVKTDQGNAEVETLKRIYTERNSSKVASRDYIEEYFFVLLDEEIADEFNIGFGGVNPTKLKDQIKAGIRDSAGERGGPNYVLPQLGPDPEFGDCE